MAALDAVPHVGDVGLPLVVQAVDQDGAAINLSSATTLTIYLTKPDGTVLTKAGALDTTGANGMFKYVTQSGDLSAAGRWKIQGYFAVGSFSGSTREDSFQVNASRHG